MDTTKIIEDIMEQVATELHNHYIQEMRLTNYAHRLIKLNKIIEASKVCTYNYSRLLIRRHSSGGGGGTFAPSYMCNDTCAPTF